MSIPAVTWQWCTFAELTVDELYGVLELRQTVFMIEQACIFPDIDWHDQAAMHLLGWTQNAVADAIGDTNASGRRPDRVLAACLRCLPPGEKYTECAIGRVVTAGAVRGTGLGRRLMAEGIRRTEALYPGQPIRIGAQQHLERFYGSFGFETVSAPYLEDGIVHVDMLRSGEARRDVSDDKGALDA